MRRKPVRFSRFLSLILRHKPERIGLALDAGGWARVDNLIDKANAAGIPLTEELLHAIVENNDKQRFSFSEDGLRIRANQGHSIPVDLGLEPVLPPEFLYHGTATRFLDSIRQHGLLAGNREYVHLSPDEKTAVQVGQRHGKAVVLIVRAAEMYWDGLPFYRSVNGVWLARQVPVGYINFPAE